MELTELIRCSTSQTSGPLATRVVGITCKREVCN